MSVLRKVQDLVFGVFGHLPVSPSIRVLSGGCGFFGDVFMALNGIRFTELNRLCGTVHWDRRSLYFDPASGPNAWSCFFADAGFRLSKKGAGFASTGLTLPYRPGSHDFIAYGGLTVRRSVHRAIVKYCTPRQDIADAVDQFAENYFAGSPTLGVHVRQTDAARGLEDRKVVTLDLFLNEARAWLDTHAGAKVFVATDNQNVVAAFRNEFGDRLIFQNCIRSEDGTSLHGHYDDGVAGSPYQKGREVMVDALLLARCDHLIRSHSRVTCYSLCANPDLTFSDLDLKYLDVNRTQWLHEAEPNCRFK